MKVALITGGSRGIGRACSLKLAEVGYHVLINYLSNHSEAVKVQEAILAAGGSAELLPFNVSNQAEAESAIATWQQTNEGKYVEVLVNNAGIRKDNLLVFMENEEWNSVLDTSLNGFFYLTRILIKNMLSKKSGRIVNIVSLSGLKGMAGQTNYSAAKGAIIAATKALALEVAKKKVTVNAVAPGFIATDMTADLNQDELKGMIPVGRFGKPEEVADLVVFLASPSAAYITGQVVSINGGLYT